MIDGGWLDSWEEQGGLTMHLHLAEGARLHEYGTSRSKSEVGVD